MKINVGQILVNYKGEPVQMEENGHKYPVTLRRALEIACLNVDSPDLKDGKSKYEVYEILRKISDVSGWVDLSSEECSLLKDIVGKFFGVGVVGAVYDAIERHPEGCVSGDDVGEHSEESRTYSH